MATGSAALQLHRKSMQAAMTDWIQDCPGFPGGTACQSAPVEAVPMAQPVESCVPAFWLPEKQKERSALFVH